jgi:hypothetical protein
VRPLALAFLLIAGSPTARADVLPPPSHPEWNDEPAPEVPAPGDAATALAALGAGLVIAAFARREKRT